MKHMFLTHLNYLKQILDSYFNYQKE